MARRLTAAMVAAAAIGGPYVATETEIGKNVSGSVSAMVRTASSTNANRTDNFSDTSTAGPYHAHYQTESLWDQRLGPRTREAMLGSNPLQPSLVGGPVHDLRDVLRFDITPNWISGHFARVTTVLADLQLDGLRVPLVTGTDATDLAGTITYYFDHSGQMQRVNVQGFVGDPADITQLMQQYYHMSPEPTLDAGVFTVRWNGMATGLLKLTRAPVMYSDATHQRYTVFLELNQPNLAYGLSPAAQQIVRADRYTGRW
ncbi:hypothetical protein FF011L_23020 [Roseimaritima multifibrata]|uniref:DUF6690 domain-containing protein n=1 Tax=Roseimaritima multifibrata TaxID=1930274 RepID=A0A517MF68_9BACT|nr:DUF6690 family protein [Roseimaritima multifibrata]QDS93532.1 hypothetical protein FF011L_23020 [Roseimaritima multifibrata]